MNRQEIDEMMRHLPSQQPDISLLDRIWIGGWIIMVVILCIYAPQINYQPTKENDHGNSQESPRQDCQQARGSEKAST